LSKKKHNKKHATAGPQIFKLAADPKHYVNSNTEK